MVGYKVTTNFTILAWFAIGASDAMLAEDGTSYSSDSFYLGCAPSRSQMFASIRSSTGSQVYNDNINVPAIGAAWHFVAYKYDGANVELLLDCASVWKKAAVGIINNGNAALNLGRRPGTASTLNGRMDEVRIANTALSSNYIWACWMNMASNDAFNAYGKPASSGAPAVTNIGAVSEDDFMTLTGYLVSTGQDANVSAAVFWGTNDAGENMSGWTYTNRFPGWSAIGPLSTNVTPEKVGELYYFRFCASNSLGQTWAKPTFEFIWWADIRTGTVFSTW